MDTDTDAFLILRERYGHGVMLMNSLFFKQIDSVELLGSGGGRWRGFGALLHRDSFLTGPREGGGKRAKDESVKKHDYFNTESTSALMKSSGIRGAG